MDTNRITTIFDLPEIIFGAEDENDSSDTDNSTNDSGNDGSTNDENASGSTEGSQEQNSSNDDRDPQGLKSALEKERAERRKLEKELSKRTKAERDRELAERSELEQAQIKLQEQSERAQKLSAGFFNRELENTIRRAAEKAGFIDADDAINGVDRSQIEADQDEDDPSNVSVDEKSVEKVVKALAAKKPHFIRTGTDDGGPTGSQFGGSTRKKNTNKVDQYRQDYPSL